MITIDLSDRVAVVTGGSSGIGLACVERFLEAGAAVAFCGRDQARLDAARDKLQQKYPQARLLAHACNVLDAEEVGAFADAVRSHFGRTDMLINNAGQGRVSTFATTTDDAWREELELKYFSLLRPTRAFLPMLREARGSIVCTNSLLALQPEPHMVATSSARAGVVSLTKSLATELAPDGVRVNSILVGLIESGQWRRRHAEQAREGQSWEDYTGELARKKGIPLGRLGLPDEAAQAIFFLATPMSSYTTGSHIDVSGGLAKHV
ncbi:SDR family oxidoreductase [Chitinasiproducens palmae]|uniref:NAD(P)-dependent dehydrogenase, short-chain alcohol dehydrogenase family n=1 Tax=Chitinasiproducens palmae TaxID=1770053 RepID=A0A1H2PPG0_9BURK|nr:SDR family oxidoreductase [Chitinasiproducens palmae]SDV48635.1 NAD(P)-dependent dehydrogenase, short-chain alcohol dehydrogenase family [Chitinasiproducens palmae]